MATGETSVLKQKGNDLKGNDHVHAFKVDWKGARKRIAAIVRKSEMQQEKAFIFVYSVGSNYAFTRSILC